MVLGDDARARPDKVRMSARLQLGALGGICGRDK